MIMVRISTGRVSRCGFGCYHGVAMPLGCGGPSSLGRAMLEEVILWFGGVKGISADIFRVIFERLPRRKSDCPLYTLRREPEVLNSVAANVSKRATRRRSVLRTKPFTAASGGNLQCLSLCLIHMIRC
jgi:hypothetical protein